MAASVRGVILNVTDTPVGDVLVGDHAAGVGVLQVNDAFDFAEEGGSLRVGTEELVYTGIDDDTDQVILDIGTSTAWEQGTQVVVLPETREKVASIRIADDGDAIDVRVPANWYPMVADAIRDPDQPGVAALRFTDGEYVFEDVWGGSKTIAGESIVGPLPNADIPGVDPVAPASSPTPTTQGGLRQVFVKYDGVDNPTLVSYELHVTATPGAPAPTAGDPATLFKDDPGTLVSVTRLPDGTAFAYDTDYFFAVFAHSGDQYAPAPSAWVSGRMDRTASGDLVAGSVTTELLNSVLAILGTLQVGSGLIEMSPPTSTADGSGGYVLGGGIVIKDPANPTGDPLVRLHPMGCTFRGRLVADIVTVLQDLVINGNSSVSGGSTQTFKNGVPDPTTGPAWTVGPQTGQAWPVVPAGYSRRGFGWDSSGSQWYELLLRSSNNRAYARTISTAGVAGAAFVLGRTLPSGKSDTGNIAMGLVVNGSSLIYGWGIADGSSNPHFVTKTNLSGTLVSQAALATDERIDSIGRDHGTGDVVLAGSNPGGYQYVTVRSASSLAETKRVQASPGTLPLPSGVTVGSFDFGAERIVGYYFDASAPGFTAYVPNWGAGTVTEDTSKRWVTSDSYLSGGFALWDGSNFLTVKDGAVNLSKWSGYYPASDGVWSSVYQDLTAGGHTAASPFTSATVPARNYVTLTLPPSPSGVTGSDVWVGYAASGNAGTKYKRAETLSGRTLALTGKSTSGSTTIPAGSTAGGSPALIRSEATGWQGSGDGTFTVATPTTSGHAVNKAYVDVVLGGSTTDATGYVTSDTTLFRVGKVVTYITTVVRSANPASSGYITFTTIPSGFRPSATTALNAGVQSVTTTWTPKARVDSSGNAQIAMSPTGGSANGMNITGTWLLP